MFEKIMEFLKAPTVRRLLVFVVGFGVVALNKKFGLELSAEQIVADAILTLGYLAQSAFTDVGKARAAALVEASIPAPVKEPIFSDSKPTPPMRPQSP